MNNPYSTPPQPGPPPDPKLVLHEQYPSRQAFYFVVAISFLLLIYVVGMWVLMFASMHRDQQFIEQMHEAERSDAIDFRLHRLDLDLLRDL